MLKYYFSPSTKYEEEIYIHAMMKDLLLVLELVLVLVLAMFVTNRMHRSVVVVIRLREVARLSRCRNPAMDLVTSSNHAVRSRDQGRDRGRWGSCFAWGGAYPTNQMMKMALFQLCLSSSWSSAAD
eukprot:scaffold5980_cov107-Skeletonema_marinoi.AAC.1